MIYKFTIPLSAMTLIFAFTLGVNNAIATSISPAITEVNVAPGQAVQKTILIENDGLTPSVFQVKIDSLFPALDNVIFPELNDSFNALDWVNAETSFTVPAQEIYEYTFSLSIPENAAAGGKYITINFRELKNASAQSNVDIENNLSATIFVTVAGETKQEIDFFEQPDTSLSLEQNKEFTSSFSVGNYGNNHEIVIPEILITSNQELVKKIGLTPQLILPNTFKDFEYKLNPNIPLGQYQIQFKLNYDSNKTSQTEPKNIFVRPPLWQMLSGVIAGAAVLNFALKHKFDISVLKSSKNYVNKQTKSLQKYYKESINTDEAIASIENERQIVGLPKNYQKPSASSDKLLSPIAKQTQAKLVKESVDSDIDKLSKTRAKQASTVTKTTENDKETTIIKNTHTMIIREETKPAPIKEKSEKKKINIKFD